MRKPRSALAAVLLNLTGLGLGYAYLGRWVRLAVALVGTAAIVGGAFWTDAASRPWGWRGLVLLWLGTQALDAGVLATRHPRPTRSRLPILGALAAVVAVVGGYVFYGIAGRAAYADGLAAMDRADCAAAVERFDTVTGLYKLTLSSNVAAAQGSRTECQVFQRAAGTDDPDEAVDRLIDFGEKYPDSVLDEAVADRLVQAYDDWARELRDLDNFEGAIDVFRKRLDLRADDDVRAELADTYLDLAAGLPTTSTDALTAASEVVQAITTVRDEFDDTPAAEKAPQVIADAYHALTKPYAEGKFCDAEPIVAYFAGLDEASLTKAVAAEADGQHQKALFECGLSLLRANDATTAEEKLSTFMQTYPKSPAIPQARSALIAAKVAQGIGRAMTVPPPYSGNNTGSIPVTFYNDARDTAVTVYMTGPDAHEFTLPKCGAACPADYPLGSTPCPTYDGRPSLTLNLKPGKYYFTSERSEDVTALSDEVEVLAGFTHHNCLYVERLF